MYVCLWSSCYESRMKKKSVAKDFGLYTLTLRLKICSAGSFALPYFFKPSNRAQTNRKHTRLWRTPTELYRSRTITSPKLCRIHGLCLFIDTGQLLFLKFDDYYYYYYYYASSSSYDSSSPASSPASSPSSAVFVIWTSIDGKGALPFVLQNRRRPLKKVIL